MKQPTKISTSWFSSGLRWPKWYLANTEDFGKIADNPVIFQRATSGVGKALLLSGKNLPLPSRPLIPRPPTSG